jgi:hypothetical protein
LLFAILAAALGVLLLDHGKLLRRAGARGPELVRSSWRELSRRRFLEYAVPERLPIREVC